MDHAVPRPRAPRGAQPSFGAPRTETPAVRARFDVRPHQAIHHTGDPADAVLRVERGMVKLVAQTAAGQDRIVAVLGAGDTLGAFEVLSGRPHAVDAVALTRGALAVLDADAFRRHLKSDPHAALALVDTLGERVHRAWGDLTNAYLPVEARLAGALFALAERFAEPAAHGRRVLRCGLNHHAFAALIGAQRGSVSAAMKTFREAGVASGARGTYVIDIAGLALLAPPTGGPAERSLAVGSSPFPATGPAGRLGGRQTSRDERACAAARAVCIR
jgi:CRP/FNR family transcriptional regulator, cyclic AMP receptor protein